MPFWLALECMCWCIENSSMCVRACVQDVFSIFIPRSVYQKKTFLILLHKDVCSLSAHLLKRTGCIYLWNLPCSLHYKWEMPQVTYFLLWMYVVVLVWWQNQYKMFSDFFFLWHPNVHYIKSESDSSQYLRCGLDICNYVIFLILL